MGIFFESQPRGGQAVQLEAILQPYVHEALTADALPDDQAAQRAATAVGRVRDENALKTLSKPVQDRLSSAMHEVLLASYKARPVSADVAPVVAASASHEIATQARSKQINWWRLLVAIAVLAVLVVAAIWTEAAGLKTAPDNLWKIASAGVGSVVGVLIGEKVSS